LIGKSPQTLILDITYQGSEIRIDYKGEIKYQGEVINDFKAFKKIWDKNK